MIKNKNNIDIQQYVANITDYIKNNYKETEIAKLKTDSLKFSISDDFEENETIAKENLQKYLSANLKPTFKELLIKYIDEKGEKDSVVYKRAGVDRKLYSKIMGDWFYHPSKSTVLAFGFSLKLDFDNFNILLESAGYSLSKSVKRDLIIEYLIKNKEYNLYDINYILDVMGEQTI